MNALIVGSEFPPGPGGIGRHAHALARALSDHGWRVTVVTPQDYVDPPEVEAFNAAQPFAIVTARSGAGRATRTARRVEALWRAWHDGRPDVVVATGAASLALAALLPARVPLVALAAGSEIRGGGRALRRLTLAGFRRAEVILCPSELTRRQLHAVDPTLPVRVVSPATDTREFRATSPEAAAAFRQRAGVGNAPMILTVGTISERKGQPAVVRALGRMQRHSDAQYVCIGREASPGTLVALAEERGVGDRVRLLGQLTDGELASAYTACDVYALVGRHTASGDLEGFGISALEAAACGCAVVLSDATGVAECVGAGLAAVVTAADDPTAIDCALDELLGDQGRREALGTAAREFVAHTANWESVGSRFDALMRAVVADRASLARNAPGPTRLVVISGTPHFRRADGAVVGWAPTVRELDQIAPLFDEVVHVAPIHVGVPPPTAQPYASPQPRVRGVLPAGGPGLGAKLAILPRIPGWVKVMRSELRDATAVHVRCPANVSLVGVWLVALKRRPRVRWFKYAGNWSPTGPEPVSYRLQRSLLRRGWGRGTVTVNGRWPGQPEHVVPFVNPSLTDAEIEAAGRAAGDKQCGGELRLLFVGRLDATKGPDRAVDVLAGVVAAGLDAHLDIVGDGPEREGLARRAARLGVEPRVRLHGWMNRTELDQWYARAHFLVLPSGSEGFPKVVAEGMAYGVVPVVGAVSCIAQELAIAGCGVARPYDDIAGFVQAIVDLSAPDRWRRERDAAVAEARRYTYAAYIHAVRAVLAEARGGP